MDFLRNLDLDYFSVTALFLGCAFLGISFGIFIGPVKIDKAVHPRANIVARCIGIILVAVALILETNRQWKAGNIAELERQIEGLRTIEAKHIEAQQTIESLESRLAASNNEANSLISEIKTLSTEVESLREEAERSTSAEEVEQLQAQISQLEQANAALANDLDNNKSLNAALSAELARNKRTVEQLVLEKSA